MTGKLIRDTSTPEKRAWWEAVQKAADRVRGEQGAETESADNESKAMQGAGGDDTQEPAK